MTKRKYLIFEDKKEVVCGERFERRRRRRKISVKNQFIKSDRELLALMYINICISISQFVWVWVSYCFILFSWWTYPMLDAPNYYINHRIDDICRHDIQHLTKMADTLHESVFAMYQFVANHFRCLHTTNHI